MVSIELEYLELTIVLFVVIPVAGNQGGAAVAQAAGVGGANVANHPAHNVFDDPELNPFYNGTSFSIIVGRMA